MAKRSVNNKSKPDNSSIVVRFIFALLFTFSIGGFTAPAFAKTNKKNTQKIDSVFFEGVKAKILNNDAEAIQHFDWVVKKMPDNAAAHFYLSELWYKLNDRVLSLTQSEQAALLFPDNKWYQFQFSMMLAANRKFEEAAVIQAQLAKKSRTPKIHYYYQINFLQQAGQYQDAIDVLTNAFKHSVADESYQQLQQQLMQMQVQQWINKKAVLAADTSSNAAMQKSFHDSISYFQEKYANEAQIQQLLIEHCIEKQQYKLALEKLTAYINNKKINFDSRFTYLASFLDNYATQSFVKHLHLSTLSKALQQEDQSNTRVALLHSFFLERDGDFKASRTITKQILSADTTNQTAWRHLILSFIKQKENDSVVTYATQAIKNIKQDPDLYYWLGNAFSALNKSDSALENYSLTLGYIPKNEVIFMSVIYTAMGDEYYKIKNYKACFDHFEKALKLHAENINALNNYSYYLAEQDLQLEKAAEMSLKTISISPHDPTYLDTYARILYKQGRFDEAKKYLLNALIIEQESQGVLLEHMGDVEFRLGNKQIAIDYWKKAAQKGENSADLHKKINDEKIDEP